MVPKLIYNVAELKQKINRNLKRKNKKIWKENFGKQKLFKEKIRKIRENSEKMMTCPDADDKM